MKAIINLIGKKTTAVSILMTIGSWMAFGQITISDCQEKAKANYPIIRQYDLISKSLEYNLSNAGKAFLPNISLTGIGGYIISGLPATSLPGTTPEEDSKVKFIGIGQINQALWDGGATRAVKEISRANAEVEKSNVEVSVYAIRERVNQLFFGILLIDEQTKNLGIARETLERNFNRLQLARDNGVAYQTDVDEVKAEILNVGQKKIEFDYTRKGYVEMLSYLTGQAMNANVQLVRPDFEELPAELIIQRPEMTLYVNQRKLVNLNSSMNKANNMPKIGLLAAGILIQPGTQIAISSVSSLAVAGVSVSWSTNSLYKTSNNRQLDKLQLDKINVQQETFAFNSNLQLRQSNNEIEKQKLILKNDDEIVSLKANIKKSYQIKYDNGMCSMTDLIDSVSKENEALSNKGLHQIQLLMNLYNHKHISGN